jgi:uncharacterized membrane protein YfcA
LIIWAYVFVSTVGGLLVGILGTGGSLLLLPSLTLILTTSVSQSDPLRLAAGTTMATVAVGAIAGAVAQYRHGQLDRKLLHVMSVPYVAGGLLGPWLSRLLPTTTLSIYVAAVIVLVALRMLRSDRRDAAAVRDYQAHRLEVRIVLLLIGIVSSVAGVASGIFAIPYLSRFSLPMRTLIGTSTAAAALYALSGAVGYAAAGWSVPDRPPGSVGFVYLPAFLVMATTAFIVTPLGVRLARRISERLLRKGFAIFLLAAAVALVVS